MSKFSTDNRDKRSGAYDPIDKDSLPQPHQVKTAQRRMKRPSLERMSEQMRCPGLRRFYRKVWSESPSRR